MKYIFNVYLFNVLMSISCCFGSDKILISKDVGACCEVHDLMDGNLYGIHTNLCINFFSGNKKLNFFANGSLKYLTSGDFAL
ncbi:MAG: hypothetical protein KAH32_07170, partial [Chlamydiia bacterium]|nr:hypothetical protein [Chlamydiia bacterium]